MPAVHVDDLTVLPRLATPGLGDTVRPVQSITTAPRGFEGEGFPVRRAFAGVDLSLLDPFVHMDQMGEVEYGPGEPKGTPWHPHRGFETVTYMIDGVMDHQDSHGGGGSITNGDTQWMTAGSGMLHIETPPEWLVSSGGLFHGVQLWVNLPRDQKWSAPRYQDLRSSQLGLISTADACTMAIGVCVEQRPVQAGQLAVLGRGDFVSVGAGQHQDSRTPSMEVLVLGGRPIREPVAWGGPFVMNTRAEVMQAFEDFQKGRMGQIPAVHGLSNDPRDTVEG